RIPDQHLGRILGGTPVYRAVLRESRQAGAAAPHRLVQHAVDPRLGLEARYARVELLREAAVDGTGVGGGALEDEEEGEHGAKISRCAVRGARYYPDVAALPRCWLRIVSNRAPRTAHRSKPPTIRISAPRSDRGSPPDGPARCRRTAPPRR